MTVKDRSLFKKAKSLISFDDFLHSPEEFEYSPLLSPQAKKWAYQIPLKASLISGASLLISFIISLITNGVEAYFFLGVVYFLSGIPALIESIKSLSRFQVDIDVLMTLAAFFSLALGKGFEGGLLLVLFAFSESLELLIESKAKKSIKSLNHLSPDKALRISEKGIPKEVPLDDIQKGDFILIQSGDIVPLDGFVEKGSCTVSLAHLTGESEPIGKYTDDLIPSGAKIVEGSITLKVEKKRTESTLHKVIELITQAQQAKPKLQSWLSRWSPRYALSIIIVTLLTFVLLPLFIPISYFGEKGSLFRSLAFLVAASPCALIIGPPIAFLSALSTAARKGILLKGSAPLEALNQCKTLIFDKTGTLTTGLFHCLRMEALTKESESCSNQALSLAYALERSNNHPLTKAILNYTNKQALSESILQDLKKIPGFGLKAYSEDLQEEIFMGNERLIKEHLSKERQDLLETRSLELKKEGHALAYLAFKQHVFIFVLEDQVRKEAQQLVSCLKKELKLSLVLLTGDHKDNAEKTAYKLGINNYYGECTPEQKLTKVQEYAKSSPVAFIGDGVNDAPSLAWAHVGIAMGGMGTMTAIEAADVILLKDSLAHLLPLLKLAKATNRIIIQNVTFALFMIIFASLGSLAGFVPLWLAVILHEGGTVLVGFNGLRLLRK